MTIYARARRDLLAAQERDALRRLDQRQLPDTHPCPICSRLVAWTGDHRPGCSRATTTTEPAERAEERR